MATFYEILEVENTATREEIKKAYRKLSKKLHPDVNKEEGAQAVFEELTRAYEVLYDEDNRKDYDDFLINGGPVVYNYSDLFAIFKNPEVASTRGKDIVGEVKVTAEELSKGATVTIEYKRNEPCVCPDIISDCDTCKGKGKVPNTFKSVLGTHTTLQTCPDCNGSKNKVHTDCKAGVVTVAKEIDLSQVKNDGENLKFLGEGQPGFNGGRNGDLIITVIFEDDVWEYTRFEDLEREVYLPLPLYLEGTVKISMPNGEIVEVKPQLNEQMVFKGKAFAGKDTYIKFKLNLDELTTEHKKRLLEFWKGEFPDALQINRDF